MEKKLWMILDGCFWAFATWNVDQTVSDGWYLSTLDAGILS